MVPISATDMTIVQGSRSQAVGWEARPIGVRSVEELEANRGTVDQLFGETRSKAWRRVADELAITTPTLVFDIVRAAKIETRVQTVLAMRGAVSLPVMLGQSMFWSAVAGGIAHACGLPPLATLPLLVGASTSILMPQLDPMLALVGKLTGIQVYSSTLGAVSPQNRRLVIHTPLFDRSDVRTHTVTHEILHVIDFSCGTGLGLSAEPEFMALYDAICRGEAASPSDYALTSARELFAEAGAAYLGVDRNLSRAALREKNPELCAYFDELFESRLPQIVRDGGVRPSTEWTNDLIGEISLHHPFTRSVTQALHDAVSVAQQIDDTKDELSADDRTAIADARKRLQVTLESCGEPPKGIGFEELPAIVKQLRQLERIFGDLLAT